MKHTFRYILCSLALLVSTQMVQAQVTNSYKSQNGVSTGKKVSDQNSDGSYTITLETFAEGTSALVERGVPADIVLVLDVSGSMSSTSSGNNPYVYRALDEAAYSYNSYGNNQYYYKHTDGNYYQVYRDGRRLYYTVGGGYNSQNYYLYGTGVQTNRPSQAANNNSTIWTGVLYERVTKLKAMQDAVGEFVDIIVANDATLDLPAGQTGNQISIVKFASNTYNGNNITYYPTNDPSSIDAGNNMSGGTNYTQVVRQFTAVAGNGAQTLKTAVNQLQGGGGTRADFGMIKAGYLLADLVQNNPNRESVKTVVMFTDGEPGMTGYDATTANNTVEAAYNLIHDYDAVVYTVGVFGPDVDSRVDSYMAYTSSDYPDAKTVGSGGEPGGYYQKASEELDLSEIFTSIAHGAGGSSATVGTSTEVRDVVTSSFTLPDNTSPSDVTVSVWKISRDGNSWNEDTQYDKTGIHVELGKKSYTENGKTVERDTIGVTGFDFSKDDTVIGEVQQGDGNWVGTRYDADNNLFYAGRKLQIEFKIKEVGDATGGSGTATNTAESGVYVLSDGKYTNVNPYEVPHTTLPVNIRIKKDGLRSGESATFEIHRAKVKMIPLVIDGVTIKSKVDPSKDSLVVEYNAIGKPNPDPDTWANWSKVILTNKGADKAVVTKTLVALDPNWVYRVVEDDWGWAYTLTHSGGDLTTSNVEINPFSFTNTEKAGVVKHAEAVTINHFATSATGEASEEHYSSSKTKFD